MNKFGIHGYNPGCIRDQSWLYSIKIPALYNIINPIIYIDTPYKKLFFIKDMPSPKYNKIELAKRVIYDTDGKTILNSQFVFIKRPNISGKSLLYEACLQSVAYELLNNAGFTNCVSQVFDIFKMGDDSIGFSMDIFLNAKPMDKTINDDIQLKDMTRFIIEVILQICAISSYLSDSIGMNHRDLRPSNIMITPRNEPAIIPINIGSKSINITSAYIVSYVDFGFSCIGDINTGISQLQIGQVYMNSDPCPKDGRDMFMFLSFLYLQLFTKFRDRDLATVKSYFEKWLENDITGILNKIEKMGADFDKWIYFITGNDKIKRFKCTPEVIFNDLCGD